MPLRVPAGRPVPLSGSAMGAGALPVPRLFQCRTRWCWAACTSRVVRCYTDPAKEQCRVASRRFGPSCCTDADHQNRCDPTSTGPCDQGCGCADVGAVHDAWDLKSTFTAGGVSFGALQSEIAASRPVEIALDRTGPGGHLVIVRGTTTSAEGDRVLLNDPWWGRGSTDHDGLLDAYGWGHGAATRTGLERRWTRCPHGRPAGRGPRHRRTTGG